MRPAAAARCQVAAMILAASGLLGGASEEPAGSASPPAAPACQVQDDDRGRASMAAVIQELRLREAERAPGAAGVEALDNRGYGYGPEPDPIGDLPIQEPQPSR